MKYTGHLSGKPMKVYCENCEHYKPTIRDSDDPCKVGAICNAKMEVEAIDTYYSPNVVFNDGLSAPHVRNESNDCKEYTRKWYKFWA